MLASKVLNLCMLTSACQCRLVIFDVADSWGKDLPAEGLIEKFYAVEFPEGEPAVRNCLDAIERVKQVGCRGAFATALVKNLLFVFMPMYLL